MTICFFASVYNVCCVFFLALGESWAPPPGRMPVRPQAHLHNCIHCMTHLSQNKKVYLLLGKKFDF